jgi:hypothetical protein
MTVGETKASWLSCAGLESRERQRSRRTWSFQGSAPE